jgi:2-oxoglutarate ferredoxin oxidoreductase subunit delta
MPKPQIFRDRCKGCELCIQNCPQHILALSPELNTKGYFYSTLVDGSTCIGCRICAISCPDIAIRIRMNGTMFNFFEY